jgi:integrase
MSVRITEVEGKDNIWEVDIRVDLPDGTPVRVRRECPVPGKAAAKRWAEDKMKALLVEGKPQKQQKEVPTLKEFVPRFMEGHARANQQKPSGVAAKETIIRHHLGPILGEKRLNEITTEDVQRLKVALKGKAPKTVNNVLTVLNVILKTAVEWKDIDQHPCTIKWVRVLKREMKFHDFPAFERLLEAAREAGASAHIIVLLGGDSGLRCGEIMGLEWGDVDFSNRQICVARSDWKGQVTAPKGGAIRYVPLTRRLAAALWASRHGRSKRVLCDDEGALTQKMVYGMVRRVARTAGVPAGVHILRHTFCSHLAMRGAPAFAIQRLAGHQDLKTTMRYMHLSPGSLEAAIALLEQDPVVAPMGA